jgi:hypothetical protein
LYDKEQSNLTWSSGKRKEELPIGAEEDDCDLEWKRVEEIEREIDREKEEMRKPAEERRREENRKRWLQRAGELEENERAEKERAEKKERVEKKEKKKEIEKEKEKEEDNQENNRETSVERRFRLKSERTLGQQQWLEHINKLMTGRAKPETKVRFDATDSPLSSNMEEGELDYLTQPSEEAEESENDNNNNNNN